MLRRLLPDRLLLLALLAACAYSADLHTDMEDTVVPESFFNSAHTAGLADSLHVEEVPAPTIGLEEESSEASKAGQSVAPQSQPMTRSEIGPLDDGETAGNGDLIQASARQRSTVSSNGMPDPEIIMKVSIALLFAVVYALLWGLILQPRSFVCNQNLRSVFYLGAPIGALIGLVDYFYYWGLMYLGQEYFTGFTDSADILCALIDVFYWEAIDIAVALYWNVRVCDFSLEIAWMLTKDEFSAASVCHLVSTYAVYCVIWTALLTSSNPESVYPFLVRLIAVTLWIVLEEVLRNYERLDPPIGCQEGLYFEEDIDKNVVIKLREKGTSVWITSKEDGTNTVFCNGELALGPSFVELKYVEVAVHVPCAIIKPKAVLLIGDGEGLYTEHVCKHTCVQHITVLEPLPKIAQHIREDYCKNLGAQLDPRVQLSGCHNETLADAIASLGKTGALFDLVIISKRLVGLQDSDLYAAGCLVDRRGLMVAHFMKSESNPMQPMPSRFCAVISGLKHRFAWAQPFCAMYPIGGNGVFFGAMDAGRFSEDDAPTISSSLESQSIVSPLRDAGHVASVLFTPPIFEICDEGVKGPVCFLSRRLLLTDHGSSIKYKCDFQGVEATSLVVNIESKWQKVEVADTIAWGRALFTEHSLQSAECDEAVYHEALCHVPATIHGDVKKVLIGGAGEGATLRELLRWPGMEEIVTVDIDKEAVLAWKEPLYDWNLGLFEHPKVNLIFDDINNVIQDNNYISYFDLVILDLSDPQAAGPVAHLFTTQFFTRIKSVMKNDGLLVMQSGELGVHLKINPDINTTMRIVWPYVDFFHVEIPSFQAPWLFMLASQQPIVAIPEDLEARIGTIQSTVEHRDAQSTCCYANREQPLQFYSPKCHRAIFQHLDTVIDAHMMQAGTIIDEKTLNLFNGNFAENPPIVRPSLPVCSKDFVSEVTKQFILERAAIYGTCIFTCLNQNFDYGRTCSIHAFVSMHSRMRPGLFIPACSKLDFVQTYCDSSIRCSCVAVFNNQAQAVAVAQVTYLPMSDSYLMQVYASEQSLRSVLHDIADSEAIRLQALQKEAFRQRHVTSEELDQQGNQSMQMIRDYLYKTLFATLPRSRFQAIWHLIKDDIKMCINLGVSVGASLVVAHRTSNYPSDNMHMFRLVDTPWVCPPLTAMSGAVTNVGLLVKQDSVPLGRDGKSFLTRCHLKLLYISMWENCGNFNYLSYPGFTFGLAALNQYTLSHRFELQDAAAPICAHNLNCWRRLGTFIPSYLWEDTTEFFAKKIFLFMGGSATNVTYNEMFEADNTIQPTAHGDNEKKGYTVLSNK